MSTITEKLKWLVEADATSAVSAFKKAGDAAETNLGKAETSSQKLGGQLTKAGAGALAFSGIAGAALLKAAGSFEDLAISSGKMADSTGLSVEQASRWKEVAGDIGIGADTVEGALGKMNKTLGTTPTKFADLGIEIARTKSGAEDVNGTFLNTIDRLNSIQDPAARAAAAASIFGKGWQGMAELVGTSADELKSKLAQVSDQKVINDVELVKAREYRATLDNLHDSVENLGLSLGQSAIPVISVMAGLITKAIEAFTKLDQATNGAAGGLAAGAVAMAAVGGGMAEMAGLALHLKGRFTDAEGAMTKFGRASVTGAALAGIAMTAYALDAQDAAKATANLQKSIEDLSTVSDADLLNTFVDTVVKGMFAEKDLKGTTDELAKANLEGAMRVKDMIQAHIANGTATQNEKDSIGSLIRSISDEQAAREQKIITDKKGATTTEVATQATADNSAATDAAKIAIDGIKKATDDATKKSDEYAKSLQGQLDKLDALYPKQYDAVQAKYDYRQASEDTMIAVANLNTVLGDHKSKEEDIKSATDNARDAIIGASEKYATMEGAATGSEGAIRRQIKSLQDQEAGLAPGSPLRQFLDQYIADLNAIPSNISTIMDLHISSGQVTTAAGDVIGVRKGAHAAGTDSAPAGIADVAEDGMELVIGRQTRRFRGGETVLNNRDTKAALGGGGPIIHQHFYGITGDSEVARRSAREIGWELRK